MDWLPRILITTALAALAHAGAPAPAAAQSLPRCGDAVRVQPGNTLFQIAQYCGTTIAALMAANPDIPHPSVIRVGQVIRMPGRREPVDRWPPVPQPQPQPQPPVGAGPCGASVVVRPGDTLARIAGRCGTTVGALMRANPQIVDPGWIRVGQVIRIPGAGPGRPPQPEPPRPPWPGPVQPAELRFNGTVTGEGISCPSVRGDDGRLYTLTGSLGALRAGERVQVIGREAQASICRQGTTVQVRQINRIGAPVPQPPPPAREDITGTLTWEGVTCPAMRGDDGRLYTLAGDIGGFEPGDRVQVLGQRAQMSICMQGTTIDVQRIRPAR